MSGRPRAALNVSEGERADLRKLQRSRKASPPVRKRADVVLACADGSTDVAVARHLGVSAQMVGMWRRRYMESGLESLEDKGRSGRPRGVTASDVGRVVALTLLSSPDDSRRWTIQSMVERSGLSHRGVQQIWRDWDIKPGLGVLRDLTRPPLVERVVDVVGVYNSPSVQAMVMCAYRQPLSRGVGVMFRLEPVQWDQAEGDPGVPFEQWDIDHALAFRRFLDGIRRRVPADLDVQVLVNCHTACMTALSRHWCALRRHVHVHVIDEIEDWRDQSGIWGGLLSDRPGCQAAREVLDRFDEVSVGELPITWIAGREHIEESKAATASPIQPDFHRQWRHEKRRLAGRLARVWREIFDETVMVVTLTYRADERIDMPEWDRRVRRDWRRLRDKWGRDWGRMTEYILGWELTRRPTPHLHLMIPYRGEEHRADMAKWLLDVWARITGEETAANSPRQRLVRISVYHVRKAVEYIMKDVPRRRADHRPMDELHAQTLAWARWSASRTIQRRLKGLGRATRVRAG